MLFEKFFIYLFRNRLIVDVIAFLLETDTADTIGATATIKQGDTVGTILAFLRIQKLVAPDTVNRLIAKFTFDQIKIIYAVARIPDKMSVIAFFIFDASENKVAIFASPNHVGVDTVFTGGVHEPVVWHSFPQIVKLLKERAGKINIASVAFGIPIIRPPFFMIIDEIGRAGRIHGDD